MQCRVCCLLDFDLKIRSGQVCKQLLITKHTVASSNARNPNNSKSTFSIKNLLLKQSEKNTLCATYRDSLLFATLRYMQLFGEIWNSLGLLTMQVQWISNNGLLCTVLTSRTAIIKIGVKNSQSVGTCFWSQTLLSAQPSTYFLIIIH